MILPRPLPEQAVIGICSPAGPVRREKLEPAIKRIEGSGHRVILAENVFGKRGFLSGDDETRAGDLHALFSNPEIDAVFCSRGGYGTGRLLNRVDSRLIAQSRKPFLGFSDVTALQWKLFREQGIVTYSGPLAVEWDGGVSEATLKQCWKLLSQTETGNLLEGFPKQAFARFEVLRGQGEVTGTLMPGNLALITTLLGTPNLPDLKHTILFIEDISESPYRFDRMIFHLRNAGVLDRLKGLLVGDFGWPGDDGEFELARQTILEATAGTEYPIMVNLPYGHGKERMTLPVGAPVTVTFDQEPSLSIAIETAAV